MLYKSVFQEGVSFTPSFAPKPKRVAEFISGFASLFGSLLSSELSSMATRESEKFSKRMTEDNQAFQRESWMLQNAYNSPNAQIQRGTQAGLNPLQSLGQGLAGPVGEAIPVNARQENKSADILAGAFNQVSDMISKVPIVKSESKKNDALAELYNKQGDLAVQEMIALGRKNNIDFNADQYQSAIPIYRNRQTGEISNIAPPPEPAEGSPMEAYNEWYQANENFNNTYEDLNPNKIPYASVIQALEQNAQLIDNMRNLDARVYAYQAEKLQSALRYVVSEKQLKNDDVLSALAYKPVHEVAEILSQAKEHLANVKRAGAEVVHFQFLNQTETARQGLLAAQTRLDTANAKIAEYQDEFNRATDPTRRAALWNDLLRARADKERAETDLKGARLNYERAYNSSPEGITDFDKDLGFGKRIMYGTEWLLGNLGHLFGANIGYNASTSTSQFSGNVNSTSHSTVNSTSNSTVHNVGTELHKNGKGVLRKAVIRK